MGARQGAIECPSLAMSCRHRSSSLGEEEEEEVTALVTQPLQSCPLSPCPQGLTLATVPCPLQLQLFLLCLLLYKEEEGHKGVHTVPAAKSPRGTPTLFSQGAPQPIPQVPSQMGQHSSSGCTWWVQLRGWHKMGSQITVRFWGQQGWGSLQRGTTLGCCPFSTTPV